MFILILKLLLFIICINRILTKDRQKKERKERKNRLSNLFSTSPKVTHLLAQIYLRKSIYASNWNCFKTNWNAITKTSVFSGRRKLTTWTVLKVKTLNKITQKVDSIACEFWFERFYIKLKRIVKPGTVACAVILATGTVDIGCLRW